MGPLISGSPAPRKLHMISSSSQSNSNSQSSIVVDYSNRVIVTVRTALSVNIMRP